MTIHTDEELLAVYGKSYERELAAFGPRCDDTVQALRDAGYRVDDNWRYIRHFRVHNDAGHFVDVATWYGARELAWPGHHVLIVTTPDATVAHVKAEFARLAVMAKRDGDPYPSAGLPRLGDMALKASYCPRDSGGNPIGAPRIRMLDRRTGTVHSRRPSGRICVLFDDGTTGHIDPYVAVEAVDGRAT